MPHASGTIGFDFGGTLFARLREAVRNEWDAYVGHRFVRSLGNGTLERGAYRRFLIQDALYLLQYARALSLAVVKADSLEEMRAASAAVHALLHGEMALHLGFCRDLGLDEAALLREEPTLETLAYGGFVMDRAQTGDALDLQVALTACLVGYAEAGARIAADPATARIDHPYRRWIDTYAGGDYRGLAAAGVIRLDAMARRRGGDARFPALLADFRTAVRLERAFWDGALREPSAVAVLGEALPGDA
ncbi:MAG: TenA family protein [Gluconacetobacter diazotrophicus]|nr:TenA family protein [Gluconacetobacter diazotrophicus]